MSVPAVNYFSLFLLLASSLSPLVRAMPQTLPENNEGENPENGGGEDSAGQVESSMEMAESWDLRDCFTTHLDCPNENVTFHLYTRENPENPYELTMEEQTLRSAPFLMDKPFKFLIHGYTGNRDFAPNTEIRPALLQQGEYNVISVDWGNLARSPCYVQATYNLEAAGKCTAHLIEVLVKNYNVPLKAIHVIGFSLGAQASGHVARYLKERQVGKLRRISGLDPAMPLFASLSRGAILDRSDAHFVDVIHTNAGNKGKLGPNGHVDFYINGGAYQPGCEGREVYDSASCSHGRAPVYYAESVNSETGFWGKECRSWLTYRSGLCDWSTESIALMGEFANSKIHGQFFMDTNPVPPYALGKDNIFGESLLANATNILKN